jgi:hypothetical protein
VLIEEVEQLGIANGAKSRKKVTTQSQRFFTTRLAARRRTPFPLRSSGGALGEAADTGKYTTYTKNKDLSFVPFVSLVVK